MKESITQFVDITSDFTPEEAAVMMPVVDLVVSSRSERAQKVAACMDKIEKADAITRYVVGVYLGVYAAVDKEAIETGECSPLQELRGFSHRGKIKPVAPGVFWVYPKQPLREALLRDGEFKGYGDFDEAATALEFKATKLGEFGRVSPQALDTVDHLMHWLAIQYPESDAAHTVAYYGTKKGRLVHGNLKGYNSNHLVFHESVLEDYVRTECNRGDGHLSPHKAVITLVSTGDFDKALQYCTPRKRKQLGVETTARTAW